MTTPSVPLEQRKLIDAAVEGLFVKALKGRVTPRLERRLADAGIDLGKKLEPMYPFTVWQAALTAACEELQPGVPLPEALAWLGEQLVIGYFETFIGSALKQLLKAMGVKRTLSRMTQNFSATNNYTQTKLTELGERHVELWTNELSVTQHNMVGILRRGLTIVGGKNVRVQIVRADAEGCTYEVRWD